MVVDVRRRVVEYDYVRALAMLLVLFGHCYYFEIESGYGGCDYSGLFAPSVVSCLLSLAKSCVYSFHMPLFVALSGAVARDVLVGQLLIQGNTHLWYLPALFLVFVIVWLLLRIQMGERTRLVLLLVLSVASRLVSVRLVELPMAYAFWFYAGYLFEKRREAVDRALARRGPWPAFAAFALSFAVLRALGGASPLARVPAEYLAAGTGCVASYALCTWAAAKGVLRGAVDWASRRSMGIYLYSDPWNYLILALAAATFGPAAFCGVGFVALFLSRLVLTTFAALLVDWVVRRVEATCTRLRSG